jgi:hypothetical protein
VPSLPTSDAPPGSVRDPALVFDLAAPPGYYHAASKLALLRRTRRAPHDELLVDFQGREVRIALRAAGEILVEGDWTWRATSAGQPLAAAGAWQESCWHRDNACDYLELELPLTGGWRLERQMLLARRDRFLWLADALLGPAGERCELRHFSQLPLAGGAAWQPAKATRDGWLARSRDFKTSVLSPALPEWRAEFSHAELVAEGGRLELRQAALGGNLYAPLWIDLNPARAKRPLTWRRLTVAENLEVVPRDVAVAYRVQVGAEQWLFYRSLTPRGNRTFLGENYSSDFACCRFLPSGKGEEIVSIE